MPFHYTNKVILLITFLLCFLSACTDDPTPSSQVTRISLKIIASPERAEASPEKSVVAQSEQTVTALPSLEAVTPQTGVSSSSLTLEALPSETLEALPTETLEAVATQTPKPTLTKTNAPVLFASPTPLTVSKIQRIKERGNRLIAGVKYDFKPFGFVDENGQVVGFEVDLIQAMADEWGVEVEFSQVTSANRIPKLVAGEVDMLAASMTHNKIRDDIIDFTQTYFLDGQSLLVRRDSQISGIYDLEGKTVTAIDGSTSIHQIQAYADVNDVTIEILPFLEYPPAIEALKGGRVDALTTDSVALYQFAQDNPELIVVGDLFTEEPYGMGLPPGDSYFNNLVNFTLQKLKKDGTYDHLYKKWFGKDSRPYQLEILSGEWPYTFATSPTTLDKPVESAVDQILAERRFVAGVKYDFPPFGFLNEGHHLEGFDVDLMREFAKRWLGDENAVEFVQVTSSDRIPKLAAGKVNIIAASMTHNQERDEEIDFSQTYFLDGQSLLVRQESGIQRVADLDGKRVTAIQGSTSIENIKVEADKLGITIEIVPLLEYSAALQILKAGRADALTTDSSALLQLAKENPGLIVVGEPFTSEPYGLGLPNYDHRFRDLVNFTLQEMKLDGTYGRLYKKWFADESSAAPPVYPIEIWPGESYLAVNTVPMLRISAGEFKRGNNEGFPNEAPEQAIFLDEFYIDQYEVTNRLYQQCVAAEICPLPKIEHSVSFADYYASPAFGNYPVVWVTWQDAQIYCQFAGKRLPTEMEWEKAARGPSSSEANTPNQIYPWGDKEPSAKNNLANFVESGHLDSMPIGSHELGASPYAVHDMAGNVREWVYDWYQRDYYQHAPKRNPPSPPDGVTKVVRGGAWNDTALDLTSTRRKDFLPESYDVGLGFRCATSTFPPTR
ncbi:MAG: transporter substrate-binding domain-containing protein [Ardenticatenaceae bacterium]